MSIVCAAIKNGLISIACDSQSSYGSIKATANHMKNNNKIFRLNDSYIGIVGWNAVVNIMEYLFSTQGDLFKFNNRNQIFETLTKVHKIMKEDYYIETSDKEEQPAETNQLEAIIINSNGLYEIGRYREVNEFSTFWAIGSGQEFALGAMNAIYNLEFTSKEIAEAGVAAAAEFDDGCSLPLHSESLTLTI